MTDYRYIMKNNLVVDRKNYRLYNYKILNSEGRSASKYKALDTFTKAYIEAAFFTDTGVDQDEELYNTGFTDLSMASLRQACVDCKDFQNKASTLLITDNYNRNDQYSHIEMAGHDFWLTRNGHGCGFWDGDWKEQAGELLTELCKTYGETYLYAGDNGKVYLG